MGGIRGDTNGSQENINPKLHIPEELAQELHNHEEKLRKYLDLETTKIHGLIDEFLAEVAKTHDKEKVPTRAQKSKETRRKSRPRRLALHSTSHTPQNTTMDRGQGNTRTGSQDRL